MSIMMKMWILLQIILSSSGTHTDSAGRGLYRIYRKENVLHFLKAEKSVNNKTYVHSFNELTERIYRKENFLHFLKAEKSVNNKTYVHSFNELELNYYWIARDGTKHEDGPYFLLFKLFQEKMGIKFVLEIPVPPVVGVSRNGIYNGEIGQVQNGLVDIPANAYYMTYDKLEFGDYTVPISSTMFCLAVPRAPLVPYINLLFLPYRPEVWASAFAFLLAAGAVWNYIHRLHQSISPTGTQSVDMIDLVRVVVSGSHVRQTDIQSERAILTTLLVFVLVFSNAYQGKLLGYLTSPPHLPEIQTLEQASQTFETIQTYSYLSEIFERKDASVTLKEIHKKMSLYKLDNMISILKESIEEGKTGVFVPTYRFSFVSRTENLTENGQKKLHLVPECVNSPGLIAFLIPKHSPLKNNFSDFVLHIVEGGFYGHWVNAQRHRLDANGLTFPEVKATVSTVRRPLGLQEMEAPFIILSVGFGAAAVVFFMEILLNSCLKFASHSRGGKFDSDLKCSSGSGGGLYHAFRP